MKQLIKALIPLLLMFAVSCLLLQCSALVYWVQIIVALLGIGSALSLVILTAAYAGQSLAKKFDWDC